MNLKMKAAFARNLRLALSIIAAGELLVFDQPGARPPKLKGK